LATHLYESDSSEVLGHVDVLMNEGRVREVPESGVARIEAV